VRLHRRRLDQELADGRAHDGSEERALRAEQLTGMPIRRRLANSLRGLVADAALPSTMRLRSAAPVDRASVWPLREALIGLAERLERAGEINACGVARVAQVLGDGSGPLYLGRHRGELSEALWWIADGLQPCPPHTWGCPVIMKLDPEHVAWTCGRCGSIAVTDDVAERPA
jgi:hypothetical protein